MSDAITSNLITDKIKSNIGLSSAGNTGLLGSLDYDRSVRVNPKQIHVSVNTCIKLMTLNGTSAYSGILTYSRVEGSFPAICNLTATSTSSKTGAARVMLMTNAFVNADFYYTLIDGDVTFYMVSKDSYTIINLRSIMSHGNVIQYEEVTQLPPDTIKIEIIQ